MSNLIQNVADWFKVSVPIEVSLFSHSLFRNLTSVIIEQQIDIKKIKGPFF